MAEAGHLRIGALSRRVGVSPELLRAWELRYGLLRPTRSPGLPSLLGGVARVGRMRAYQEQGLSAAEAARLANEMVPEDSPADSPAAPDRSELARALERFDEPGAQAAFDRALGAVSLDALLRDLVIPYLAELGDRWEAGSATVGESTSPATSSGVACSVSRGVGAGRRPSRVLACAPGELHVSLSSRSGSPCAPAAWRIAYLGPDTPMGTLLETTRMLGPQLVVVSATTPQRVSRVRDELRTLAQVAPLALVGGAEAHARRIRWRRPPGG